LDLWYDRPNERRGMEMAEEKWSNTKPPGHHDFVNPSVKGQTAIKECKKCGEPSERHAVYERIKVIGFHGEYFAWRKV